MAKEETLLDFQKGVLSHLAFTLGWFFRRSLALTMSNMLLLVLTSKHVEHFGMEQMDMETSKFLVSLMIDVSDPVSAKCAANPVGFLCEFKLSSQTALGICSTIQLFNGINKLTWPLKILKATACQAAKGCQTRTVGAAVVKPAEVFYSTLLDCSAVPSTSSFKRGKPRVRKPWKRSALAIWTC